MNTKTEAKRRIGSKVRQFRLAKGMSQQELADAIGRSSRDTISKIELGTSSMTLETAKDIAKALDVNPIDIIYNFDPYDEFAPYIRNAQPYQLEAIRDLLGMKKTASNIKEA